MEDYTENRKRFRDDSLADSAESKLRRINSSELRFVKPCAKGNWNVNSSKSSAQVRLGSDGNDLEIDLAESEEIQDELLNILDDSDAVEERDESLQSLELDSFIRSFEEEIGALPPVVEPSSKTASEENETPQVELGYLYEASDDELGLPPRGGWNTEGKMEAIDFMAAATSPGGLELKLELELERNQLGFEDEIPCYDSLELEMGMGIDRGTAEEFVALGGLFDYSDVPFRPESLSAL